MTNEKVLNKVKKLMALSESPVEAEAKLALMKAQMMLKEHNLSIKDIHKEKIQKKDYQFNRKSPQQWQTKLILGTMRGFNCEVIQSKVWDDKFGGTKIKYIFIGAEVDLEVGEYVLDYLFTTVDSLCKKYTKTINKEDAYKYGMSEWSYMETRRTSYKIGLASSFVEKVREFNTKQEEDTVIKYSGGLTGTEMVRIKKNAVEKFIDDTYKNLKNARACHGSQTFGDSINQGKADGKSVSIHKGVNGNKQQNLLT